MDRELQEAEKQRKSEAEFERSAGKSNEPEFLYEDFVFRFLDAAKAICLVLAIICAAGAGVVGLMATSADDDKMVNFIIVAGSLAAAALQSAIGVGVLQIEKNVRAR